VADLGSDVVTAGYKPL